MICQPSSVTLPARFTVTLRVRKLPPRAHRYWLRMVRSSVLSVSSHSPMSHASSASRSRGVSAGTGDSMSWLIFHLPSFLMWMAV